KKKLVLVYDSQGRRVSKTVSNWVSGAWQFATNNLFVHDGWNLVGLLNSPAALAQSFMWGLDMSGSSHGAGGVGGLLCFSSRQTPSGTHFVAYDGNGNVVALVESGGGSSSARYEYAPFGQLVRRSGSASTLNPVCFSSKLHDDESDLAY